MPAGDVRPTYCGVSPETSYAARASGAPLLRLSAGDAGVENLIAKEALLNSKSK